MDVIITFTSQNNWALMSEDRINQIPYCGRLLTNGIDVIIDQNKVSEIITKDKIIDIKYTKANDGTVRASALLLYEE